MAEIVGAFLGAALQVAQWVSKPISRQFNYLCCFTTNIDDLKHEAQKLDGATRGLQGRVDTAIDNVEEVLPEVLTWFENSNHIKEETSSILDEIPNVKSGCLKLRARFSLSRRAKKMIKPIKVLQDEGNFDVISKTGPPAAMEEVLLGTTYEFESRKQIKEEMMTALRDEDVNMIGICGMGGLGKTTMAKQIMNKVLKEQVFQETVIVVFSQQVDKSKIQNEIAGQLGLNLKEETSEADRACKLLKRLSSGTKRILLVLDDVWEGFEVHEFGIPCDAKGCTILVTSRKRGALLAMNVQKIFEMDELREEEALFLFKQRAGTCVDHSESIKPIAQEVVKKCGGLPIALITVGTVLREKTDVRNWRDTLRQLRRSDPDIPEVIAKVYNPLKLSYDDLSTKEKFVFLLCCLFPEDANIPLEELTHFYSGLGKFEGIWNVEEERDRMHTLTERLKSRCLLLSGEDESHVRMHDVVRDVCIFIAKQEIYIGGNDCKWISSSHQLPIRWEFPNLHLLFLRCNSDLSLLEGSRDLRVLSIWGDQSLRSLPHTTQSLRNLTTLLLYSCHKLETISDVGELVNLEILICRYCYSIEELPPKMKGLNRLKLLELTNCKKLKRIGRGIISSLIGLEELKMLGSFRNWEAENAELKENAGLTELAALTNLTCLEIDISDPALAAEQMQISPKLQRFRIRIDIHAFEVSEFDKSLALELRGEICLGDWILQLLRDTEYLKLSGNGANKVDLVNSRNIRRLHLGKCDTIRNVVRTSYGDGDVTVFPLIEHLELVHLPELQEICDGPISSTSFQNLKELRLCGLLRLKQLWKSSENNCVPILANLSSIRIIMCYKLRNLGQLSIGGKDCLPQLQVIDICWCAMMEQVFLWNEENQNSESRNQQVLTKVFPKLGKVQLERLPNLETFYQGIEGIEFPLLEILTIKECPKMKLIRSNERSGSSSSATIDDDSAHLFYKVSFGNLKWLTAHMIPFGNLKLLRADGHKFPLSHFYGLVELIFYEVNGCKSLIPSSVAINLLKLRELRIESCNEMLKVIEDVKEKEKIASGGERAIRCPKLEKLCLHDLPKLVTFCEWEFDVELRSLRKVSIEGCPVLENFSLGIEIEGCSAPNLEAFSTDFQNNFEIGVHESVENSESEKPSFCYKFFISVFKGLKELEVHDVHRFRGSLSLFTSSVSKNLDSLRRLDIGICSEIVKVIEDEAEDEKVANSGEMTILFPKLEELRLWNLPKLVSFCEWTCDVMFPSLRECCIDDCSDMKSFTLGFITAPNLECIEIDYEEIGGKKDLNGALQQHSALKQEEHDEDNEEENDEDSEEEQN